MVLEDKKISWWRTEIGDPEVLRVSKSIREERISQGPVTVEFETRLASLLGVKHVVACTSGSTALLMALLAAGVGSGDEVIVPNRTWIATAHAVLMAGARLVLADDDPLDKSVFVEDVRRKITKKTKAILPVHLGGRAVDLDAVGLIAKENGLLLVEDAAQAFMSRNRHGFLGTQSVAGCFSLSLAKLIATGQGGFVITNDDEIHSKLTCMRNHGVQDPVHVIYSGMGFNFRFNDVLASIGLAQLDSLESRIKRVREIYTTYQSGLNGLAGIEFVPVNLDGGEIPIYAEILVDDRPALERYLADNNVQIRPYYPSLNLAPHLRDTSPFPQSMKYGTNGAFLPCGPSQPLMNVERVIALLREKYTS
jgi:dTDP-4-amino-4,6-dideoxygalactose transaminase